MVFRRKLTRQEKHLIKGQGGEWCLPTQREELLFHSQHCSVLYTSPDPIRNFIIIPEAWREWKMEEGMREGSRGLKEAPHWVQQRELFHH